MYIYTYIYKSYCNIYNIRMKVTVYSLESMFDNSCIILEYTIIWYYYFYYIIYHYKLHHINYRLFSIVLYKIILIFRIDTKAFQKIEAKEIHNKIYITKKTSLINLSEKVKNISNYSFNLSIYYFIFFQFINTKNIWKNICVMNYYISWYD
jgi:hypothetical protein